MTEVAIVVPTYNERSNVRALVRRLQSVLDGVEYEILFVDDDSPDKTADEVRAVGVTDSRVRVLQRLGKRGLASACLEGMRATSAPYICVMDGDMQHDEKVLPDMLQRIQSGMFDVVAGSRRLHKGGMGAASRKRVLLSHIGHKLSRLVTRSELTDPMSGFFMVDRRFFDEVSPALSGIGFKLLFDMVASSDRPVRICEVPYVFRTRQHETSKMDLTAGLEYLYLLGLKLAGRRLPARTAQKVP